MPQKSHYHLFYTLAPLFIGETGILWREEGPSAAVVYILLPDRKQTMADHIRSRYPDAVYASTAVLDHFCHQLRDFMSGAPDRFSSELLDLGQCSEFQKKVLLKAREIPRGLVASYGGLAELIGAPGAARAVGTALAKNPFPLILPCHRVIKSTGSVGRFGGGTDVKQMLLKREGVSFDAPYRVTPACFWTGKQG